MKSFTKVFVPILWLVALALAEPPVGDGYAPARSNDHQHDHQHDHHSSEHQTSDYHASEHQSDHHSSDHSSISQEHGPPNSGSARNAPDGYQYNSPNARNSPHGRSQSRFPPATVRVSFNQRFSSAATRSSNHAARSQHQHPAPSARLSQEYGPPASRSLSQEYGAPAVGSARTLSTEYGMPDARSTPSQEYGVPVVAARSNQNQHSTSNFRSAQNSPSHDHASPASRSQFQADNPSHSYSAPSARSNKISEGYEASKTGFGSRTAPSSSYGAPSFQSSSPQASYARSSDSVNVDSISQTYGAPTGNGIDQTYGAPSARGLSQEYGVPSSRSTQMTSAESSSETSPSSRSAPSSSYLPASRSAPPSEQYGAPEPQDGGAQGYDYARARALEELQNQEPASYDFGYQIEDQESGSDFGHSETREADKAQGSYFVVRPDGSKQTVDYEADERGFKPRISVEPAAAGYDQNAQDLARSQGPY